MRGRVKENVGADERTAPCSLWALVLERGGDEWTDGRTTERRDGRTDERIDRRALHLPPSRRHARLAHVASMHTRKAKWLGFYLVVDLDFLTLVDWSFPISNFVPRTPSKGASTSSRATTPRERSCRSLSRTRVVSRPLDSPTSQPQSASTSRSAAMSRAFPTAKPTNYAKIANNVRAPA